MLPIQKPQGSIRNLFQISDPADRGHMFPNRSYNAWIGTMTFEFEIFSLQNSNWV